uniref:Uncharacterized protein n=1 Tax=Pseudomonas phage RVTF4 TaxID=3236931 RepID=A0AB39CCJ7_9VIRU
MGSDSDFLWKLGLAIAVVAFLGCLINGAMLKAHAFADRRNFVDGCIKDTSTEDIEAYTLKIKGCSEAAKIKFPLPDFLEDKKGE